MKVKNGELFAAREPLAELLKLKFPVQTSFALAKLANKIKDALKPVDESKDGLIKKYGKEENGKVSISADDPNWEAFVKEFDELMNIQTEFVFEKVALSNCEVEPAILMDLEKFVTV